MAPSREACQLIADTEKTIGKLVKTWHQIQQDVSQVVTIWMKIRWGIVSVLDALGAAVLSVVEAAASSMAQALAGAASQAASAAIEAIMAELLKILLAAPTALFSLVSIPQKMAIKMLNDERQHLQNCQVWYSVIEGLILKWTNARGGQEYLNQMKQALPFIEDAFNKLDDITSALNPTDNTSPGMPVNPAYFNQSEYETVLFDLSQAITLTKPFSSIASSYNIDAQIQNQARVNYANYSQSTIASYNQAISAANTKYQTTLANIPAPNGHSVLPGIFAGSVNDLNNGTSTMIVKQEAAKNTYEYEVSVAQATKQGRLANDWARAQTTAALNASVYSRALGGLKEEFSYDMKLMQQMISNLASDLTTAYARYQSSKLYSNAVVNISGLVENLITSIVSMLQTINSAVDAGATFVLDQAQTFVGMARDKYLDDINIQSNPSSIQLTTDLFVGNQYLNLANSMLTATMTDSLIAEINAPAILGYADAQFDSFISRVVAIPDWDGTRGVWAVDLLNGAPAPYISVIAKQASFAVALTSLDKNTISSSLNSIDTGLTSLLNHNSYVAGVMNSYVPYVGSDMGNLTRMLNQAGALEQFAEAFAIAEVAAGIIANVAVNGLDDLVPSDKKCRESYVDMFTDPDMDWAVGPNEGGTVSISQIDQQIFDNENKITDRYAFRSSLRQDPYSNPDGTDLTNDEFISDRAQKDVSF